MSVPRRQDHKLNVNAAAKETAFGTAEATATTVQLLMGTGFVPFSPVVVKRTAAGMTTGTEGPNFQWVELVYHKGTLQWDVVYPNDFIWAMKLACGAGTSTQNAATGQYEHDITEDTTHTLLSCTIVDHIDANLFKQYTGCVCSRLTFTAGIGGASMSMDVIAKSVADTDATKSLLTDEPAIVAGLAGTANAQAMGMYIGGTIEGSYDGDMDATNLTAGSDITSDARSFTITIDNGIDVANMQTFAGVNTIVRPERGARSVTGSITVEQSDSGSLAYQLQDYLDDAEPVALEWDWDSNVVAGTAGNDYGASIIVPDADFSDVSYSYGPSGILLATYPFVGFDKDTPTYHRVTATGWNEVAAYLA